MYDDEDLRTGLLSDLAELTLHHLRHSKDYSNFVESRFPDWSSESFSGLPFLPVAAFKNRVLKSIPEEDVHLLMESSGTSKSGKSRIAIDLSTARLQERALGRSFSNWFGNVRSPMVLIANRPSGGGNFTASDAAMNGFGRFASRKVFAYSDSGELDVPGVLRFLEENRGQTFVFLGFTFQVWQFLKEAERLSETFRSHKSVVIHGGGWKKLEGAAVSKQTFANRASSVLGSSMVRNYYGMIEQTGSIYFECEEGSLHAPDEGNFVIRHPLTLEELPHGNSGVIQVQSALQRSYPGHSLLTEDTGFRQARCGCGRRSPALVVEGRLLEAEIRGCSDANS